MTQGWNNICNNRFHLWTKWTTNKISLNSLPPPKKIALLNFRYTEVFKWKGMGHKCSLLNLISVYWMILFINTYPYRESRLTPLCKFSPERCRDRFQHTNSFFSIKIQILIDMGSFCKDVQSSSKMSQRLQIWFCW